MSEPGICLKCDHVPWPRAYVKWHQIIAAALLLDRLRNLCDRDHLPKGYIDGASDQSITIGSECEPARRLCHVGEVAAVITSSENHRRQTVETPDEESRNHFRQVPALVLAGPVRVKGTHNNSRQPVGPPVGLSVELTCELGRAVHCHRCALGFLLVEPLVATISIDLGGGAVDEAFHPGAPCGLQGHQSPGSIDFMIVDRRSEGATYALNGQVIDTSATFDCRLQRMPIEHSPLTQPHI